MPSKKPKTKQAAHSKAATRQRPRSKAGTAAKSAKGTVYQLKIALDDIRPPIWRRVQTKDCTLAKLHDIIQIVMGWQDYHLHDFEIGEERYGLPEQWDSGWDDAEISSSRKIKVSQLADQGIKSIHYQYDMGDSWGHTLSIEKTMSAQAGVTYPCCIEGARACPPEDCGGPWGYANFVQAIQDPRHERHAELREWIGERFDPEAFNLDAVNKELKGAG
jgi:hypothetical protein